jgi:Mn-dependent DtxR family transcriptional regulator
VFTNRTVFEARKTIEEKAKKALNALRKKGLIQKHPTRGSMTYQLIEQGRRAAFKLGFCA